MAKHPQVLREDLIPGGITDLPRAPRVFYLSGSMPTLPMVAIVGTRRPTPEARKFAEALAKAVAGQGFAVVSGGAEGIDTAAHLGALAVGGQTLVVAPAGWHSPYPETNRQLFEQIVDGGGGYLSLVQPDQRPLTCHFLARNAVLVAFAAATVVVQAPVRSGARNAAHVARKLGRPLFVVPSAPWIDKGAGCLLELKLGARPLGSVADLLEGLAAIDVHGRSDPLQLELPLAGDKLVTGKPSGGGFGLSLMKRGKPDVHPHSEWSPVIKAISSGCHSLDSVCQNLGWETPKVQTALLHLSLAGCIRMTSAGRIDLVTIYK